MGICISSSKLLLIPWAIAHPFFASIDSFECQWACLPVDLDNISLLWPRWTGKHAGPLDLSPFCLSLTTSASRSSSYSTSSSPPRSQAVTTDIQMTGSSTSSSNARRPAASDDMPSSSPATSPLLSSAASSFLSRSSSPDLAMQRTRDQRAVAMARTVSFATAIAAALCAGSVTAFSLYGHIFQERLRYSQFQVNGVAIAASFALYLPVPLMGYVCDRAGPAPLSLLSAFLFAGGYGLAAGLYKRAARAADVAGPTHGGSGGWPYALMLFAFVCIGTGTCSIYMSALATCAKNFGKGKHRGLALAMPIAAFGLSGMWLSQVGSRVLYERLPGGERGDVDVFAFFLFLSILLFVVGVLGFFTLKIVNEEDLIDNAAGELERSGLLDGSTIFTPGRAARGGYGAIERSNPFDEDLAGDRLMSQNKDAEEEGAKLRKQWVLNAETKQFLTDHTMWLFALGFFFMVGPGEAFINNLGTVIKTLYPPSLIYVGVPTSPATHVSVVAITSTVSRLLTGTLTDLLAPSPQANHMQISSPSPLFSRERFSVSRVSFLLFFAALLSAGLAVMASGVVQDHGERFWIVSGLVGAGYGAVFSLTPIIITVIWGVENFATNWGIVAVFPCVGATLWGSIYSAVYQAGVGKDLSPVGGGGGSPLVDDELCYGAQCYATTFWAMAASVWVAAALVLLAWKGPNGWARRGILI